MCKAAKFVVRINGNYVANIEKFGGLYTTKDVSIAKFMTEEEANVLVKRFTKYNPVKEKSE